MAVEKIIDELNDPSLPIGDRKNMAYKGTFVTYGRGMGVVVETGMNTELGKIATMLQEEEEVRTPLQKRLASFGRKLAFAVLAICAIVFGLGTLRGEEPLLMLLTAISLAVAAIPEALPAVVTISLALGAKKMILQNALIRKLPAVETLGSVTYVCSDKTGTLTLNKMTLEEVYADGKLIKGIKANRNPTVTLPLSMLYKALALSNDAQPNSAGDIIGDPTEIALYHGAGNQGFEKRELEKTFPRVAEIPFDSERKCMTTFHRIPPSPSLFLPDGTMEFISFTKGATDVLINKTGRMLTSEGLRPLDADAVSRVNDKMAADGLRVLCVAARGWQKLPEQMGSENVEQGLTLLGLVGILDPPREEAKEAIAVCKTAGIIPVMITGDHPITARAIAKRLGIIMRIRGQSLREESLKGSPWRNLKKGLNRSEFMRESPRNRS